MLVTRPRWARILLAAVRLAAIYAAGVLILLIPLIVRSRNEGFEPNSQPWLQLPVIGAVCFVLGFVALAAVKRLGFALLWGLLLWWWIRMIGPGPVVFLDMPFVAWTAFAAPLYILSAIGLTETTSSRRWQVEFVLTLLIWAIIAVLAFFFGQPRAETLRIWDTPSQYSMHWRGYVYAAWPIVIGARELARVLVALWRSRKDGTPD
jgi:hypothetical protein